MKHGRIVLLTMCLVSIAAVMSLSLTEASAEDQPGTMARVIEELIEAYNSVDSTAYRDLYAPELMERYSLSSVGEELRQTMESHGPIAEREEMIGSAGDRAIVVVKMESAAFDLHLRIDDQGRLLRDVWMPHKAPANEPSTLTDEEQLRLKQRYVPIVVAMMEAIRSRDAATLKLLFDEDEDDEWTVEQYAEMIGGFHERGELKDYGPVEVTAGAEACFPAYVGEMALEFCMSIDADDKITGLKISVHAQSESDGKTMADLGTDTLRTADLLDLDALAQQFRADSGKVRFVTLLSPT